MPFREERKPGSVPTGPRPSPEGGLFRKLKAVRSCSLISLENRTQNCSKVRTSPNPDRQRKLQLPRGNLRCFIIPCVKRNLGAHLPSELHEIAILTKYQKVTETYRKQETVVNFDTTNRRGGGEVVLRNGHWIGWL